MNIEFSQDGEGEEDFVEGEEGDDVEEEEENCWRGGRRR